MTDNNDRSRKRALVEHVAEATAEFSAAHVHVHGCKLDPDHQGACLSDRPHQFGPDGCPYCNSIEEHAPNGGWLPIRQVAEQTGRDLGELARLADAGEISVRYVSDGVSRDGAPHGTYWARPAEVAAAPSRPRLHAVPDPTEEAH